MATYLNTGAKPNTMSKYVSEYAMSTGAEYVSEYGKAGYGEYPRLERSSD
jgi:hypothetical protein